MAACRRIARIPLALYTWALTPQTKAVDVVALRKSSIEDSPHQQDLGFEPQMELEAAIERSQQYLLSQQKPEGYWIGELMVDATLVADTIAYHHWNGKWTRNGSARR